MDYTIKMSAEELDLLLDATKDQPALQSVYWQLRGQWLAGPNQQDSIITEN